MRRTMRTRLLLLLSLAGVPLFGQTLGEITGQVMDASGAAITGAVVTITNTATNASRNAASTDAGVYAFPSIPPGPYDIRVEKSGFKADTAKNVIVQVQQTVRLDFTLTVGQVSESIEVSSQAAQLQTENAT